MLTFEELGIAPQVMKGIQELGFEEPMPIQEKVIPELLSQQGDLIGLAQTGTGKTAAFGLPLVQLADTKQKQTQSFILAPTRELCLQIAGDLKNFAKHIKKLNVVAIYGGASMDLQMSALRKGAHIIVATPGRMNDLLNKRKKIDLSGVQVVVLDEADEMLNMGFKEELDAILEKAPVTKTTLLFSATMPKEVLAISKNYMNSPKRITIGAKDSGSDNIDHLCLPVRSRDRFLALKRIIDFNPYIYGIVFCRTRMETKEIAAKLIESGYNADALHGDLSQSQREAIMRKFRIKSLQLLVATDVAARGLDVADITHIINYNLPDDTDTYTHRSGRTGRAGKKGISIVLINLREKYKIRNIERKLKKDFQWSSVPKGRDICEKQVLSLADKLLKIEVDHKEINKFLPAVIEKLEWLSRDELIKHFVSLEFNRFLDYYKDTEDLNPPEEKKSDRNRKGRSKGDKRGVNVSAEAGFTRIRVNLGYKDALTPRDLIGIINRRARNKNINIGKIELMKTFSYFDVESKHASLILSSLKGIEFNQKDVVTSVSDESSAVSTPRRKRKSPIKKSRKKTTPKRTPKKKNK